MMKIYCGFFGEVIYWKKLQKRKKWNDYERLEKLAKVPVEYATEVKPSDEVCISAEDVAIPFIQAVARQAV